MQSAIASSSATPPAAFTLPGPVGAALSLLPAYPGSMLLVAAINLALAKHLPEDVTALLEGKRLAIRVRDARLNFDFTWKNGHFAPCPPHAEPDVAISANAQDRGGDTEPGLVVKNALDALELPVLDPLYWTPQAVFIRHAPQALQDVAQRLSRLPLLPFPPFGPSSSSGRQS